MKPDYLSYKRAVSVCLIGLALQLVLGLVLLIYGVIQKDHAGVSGSFLILILAGVWLVLAIVYDQHRRERIELIETQELTESGARDSSAFEANADDLRVQHKRLAWMHRILVPAASLLIAAALAGVGVWRYLEGKDYLDPDKFKSAPNFGWPVALGLALGFAGFVFARYVAGMAKQPVWTNLKAGAAAAVSAAVVGLALAASQFVDYAGPDTAIRFLHVALPVLLLILSVEFVLNFLLGVYRPRRPGEFPRPAFESRILGFLAAPDRIAESIGGALNYQFGFDVTGSWFYQLISRSVLSLVLIGLGVIWLLTCLAVVEPNEQGVRIRLGRQVSSTPLESGPYLKWPWPFEHIQTFDAATARRVNLGVEPPQLKGKSILWTNDHGVNEAYFLVQPSAADRNAGESGKEGAKDFALISCELPLVYVVTDLVKFEQLADADNREKLIRAVGQREAWQHMGGLSVDQILGDARAATGRTLQQRIQQRLNDMNAGVTVMFVGVEGVHPPRETAESFEAVVQSLQKREGALRTAEREANDELIKVAGSVDMARRIAASITALEAHTGKAPAPEQAQAHAQKARELEQGVTQLLETAGGAAATAIQAARAERWVKHMSARSRAEAQVGRLAAFRACPEAYIAQTYYSTLTDIMSKTRVYIIADDPRTELRLNLEEPESSGNIFLQPPKPNE